MAPSDAGWPRPRLPWRASIDRTTRCRELPNALPVPWINGPTVEKHGDWHGFRPDATRAHHERLCAVCGEPLNARILLGSYRGEKATAGPGGHPRCILLAVQTCPHLVEQEDDETVAWEYIGSGVGYVIDDEFLDESYGSGEDIAATARPLTRPEVREIAKADPLGMNAAGSVGA